MNHSGLWMPLDTESEILSFMNNFNSLHDSCVKEIRYVSGAYVNHNESMYPVNSLRQLNIILHRQDKNYPVIEIQFNGLFFSTLSPNNEEYTTEILEATFVIHKGKIIWCDHFIVPDLLDGLLENTCEEQGIVVCARTARWRAFDHRYLGDEIIYALSAD